MVVEAGLSKQGERMGDRAGLPLTVEAGLSASRLPGEPHADSQLVEPVVPMAGVRVGLLAPRTGSLVHWAVALSAAVAVSATRAGSEVALSTGVRGLQGMSSVGTGRYGDVQGAGAAAAGEDAAGGGQAGVPMVEGWQMMESWQAV